MASPPYGGMFDNDGLQGRAYDNPISASGAYYAFLSMSELNEDTNQYELTFELLPAEWVINRFRIDPNMKRTPPPAPATLYQIMGVDTNVILATLGLKSADDLAPGTWYFLQLDKRAAGPTEVDGMIQPADYDIYRP